MASWQSRLVALFLRAAVKRRLDPHADPAAVRARVNRLAARFNRPQRWITSTPVTAGGVPGEWVHVPESQDGRVLLYLHGGGYVVCGPETHRLLVARLCRKTGARALMIDYRLAPEHPFPAAVEDAEAAYRWLLDTGIRPDHIVVAGDSAGGGLTLALLLTLRDAGLPQPAAAALLSPWTDLAFSGWSLLTRAKADPMLRLDSAVLAARHYLQGTIPTHPIASPLYADLQGLAPMLVQVGENEILLDDSRRFVTRALAAGVDARLEIWPGMMHVFQAFPVLPESDQALARMGRFLGHRLNTAGGLEAGRAPVPPAGVEPGPIAATAR